MAWCSNPELLGANPAETIEHVTGDRALQFLLYTLAITPLRRITGWNWLIKFRRMLGLFAFFYGVVHLAAYIAFDQYFDVRAILEDIVKRPFVTVGFASLVLMLPLAVTSTAGWIKRMGAAGWNRLHKAIYADSRPWRGALLVAGEEGHHLADDLWGDPARAAGLARVVALQQAGPGSAPCPRRGAGCTLTQRTHRFGARLVLADLAYLKEPALASTVKSRPRGGRCSGLIWLASGAGR